MTCPACGSTNPPAQRFCGRCGTPLVSSDSETIASPAPQRIASDSGHYVPGQILAGRYRMVGLLGRGGMGEVYRADDLKLGQPVALKFLPRAVEKDPDRLQRFLDEVRLSLKVTHPNICRVFDIGEVPASADDRDVQRHFIAMEYVDGEDLASLLRRIGRLPEDKAIEIARQLCAGLAAAHDEGVLHRDLKPANVMIDGRGRAKITDFGLAGATAGISGREAQAGTPQYMAPEQFDGRELSPQTDIYSLGLVLYELFTGKRAFDSGDLNELRAMHSSVPTNPGALVSGLSPIVERAILRCVSPDPALRPRSASSLAAALPGGDPLEMAIAAGETPSPEMVAQSGGRGELRVGVAVACLAIALLSLAGCWIYFGRLTLSNRVGLPKPPEELRVAARAAISAAGYTPTPSGSAWGFFQDNDYLQKVARENQSVNRWDGLPTVYPSPLSLWYRESAAGMTTFSNFGSIDYWDPPTNEPGMISVRVDPNGKLLVFRAVPESLPTTKGPWTEPDWAPLFAAAGLTAAEWQPADPLWAPDQPSDTRRAWTKDTLRIEATALRGRPVSFIVVPEWRKPDNTSSVTAGQSTAQLIFALVSCVVVVGAGLIARRNVRLDRSDRRGALRLALVYVAIGAAAEVMNVSGAPRSWIATFMHNLGVDVIDGIIIWLFYMAIEPYVRRHWPGTLVAWTRALDGRLRDPMVGRHLLIGALAGMGFTLLTTLRSAGPVVGLPEPIPVMGSISAVGSIPAALEQRFNMIQSSFFIPVAFLLAMLLVRVIFRRPWLANTVLIAFYFVLVSLATQTAGIPVTSAAGLLNAGPTFMFLCLILVVITRYGLFAMLVAINFSYWQGLVLTLNPSSWMFPFSLMTMATFAAIVIYGFWVSLGGQKLIKDPI